MGMGGTHTGVRAPRSSGSDAGRGDPQPAPRGRVLGRVRPLSLLPQIAPENAEFLKIAPAKAVVRFLG